MAVNGPFIGAGRRRARPVGPPPLVLEALALSPASLTENSPPGAPVGVITGRMAGSTLSLANNAGGRFALSGANVVSGLVATDHETAASHDIIVRESLPMAVNSPRDTTLTIAVLDAEEQSAPATPLAGTRSIAFGPRNGDGFQNRLAGPQLSNLFGTGSAGAAGALAVRVRIQPGGLNSNSGATTQTIAVPMLGTGGTTTSRGVHAGFGSYGTSFAGLRGRFYFLGRDQAGANHLGDRDTAGNPGSTGSARYLRSPQITPNAQGSWTGLVILRRDGAGQFQTLLVTADGTVQLGDTFAPAAWVGSGLTSGALSLGSFTGAPLTFGNWFPGDVCDLIQLDGASGSDADWQAVALGANPATVFGANLAAHYRLAGTGDLTQTAGSRPYAAFTLAQSDAANRPIIDGPQLRPARNGAGAALLAAPQFPGYVHAVSPAGVRAAANRAAVKALTGSVVRDVLVTGTATHVQGRALTPGGTQLVGWTRVTGAAATGLVETTLPGVPVGEVVIEYRREDDSTVIAVVCDRERVGLVVSLIGQSQTQIAMGDETSVTLTPNLNTSVSYCWMRGGGTVWNPPDGGFLDRQKELSDGMTAAARMLDALGTDIPVEFLCVAQQGTSIAQLMYRYSGDGLDLCGDGSDPQSGMLTSMMLAKHKRITGWLFSWATSDASSRNGGSVPIGATPYGTRGPLTERPWVERMNEFFGGVEKSTADATERSERRNLHDLGFAAAWNPWVIMLPVSRHRFNSAGAAPADTTFGAFRQQQYDLAVIGAGKAGAWEVDLGAFQIDTFMPDGETAHQDRTDPRGNIRFCLRYAQALAFAGKLSTLDPRPAFTSATRSGSVIMLATSLVNGGSLVPQTDGATLEEFEISEDDGATWSRRDGAVPFTPAISGSTVTLTRGTGSWAANTRVRYLAGWPVAVGGSAGMAATEGTRLNGVLYETRTDATPSGIAGLRAGVPLMPMWSPLVAA